ncbi:MAG: DNA recombination protein RmuC [Proteobacteria bacterium]|nr:DNA recombination protein RmuC [Pseudomonadota bacterium]
MDIGTEIQWVMAASAVFALGLGGLITFLIMNGRAGELAAQVTFLEPYKHAFEDAQGKLHAQALTFEREKATFGAQLATLTEAKNQMGQSFQALCAQALEQNNRVFLELAQGNFSKLHEKSKSDLTLKEQAVAAMVAPLKETLGLVDQKLGQLEKERQSAYSVLRHQVGELVVGQKELRQETANLVKALRAPHVRGRWGEMQLRRVVEMSGMSAHCDFLEQVTIGREDGEGPVRPDMVVRLPGGKSLVIDAKAPLAGYLDALEAPDDIQRQEHLKTHARHVRTHIMQLASRSYWDRLSATQTPEFVVLFLPGETFFSAALEQDPSLIELGVEKKVILATPATLIALLHAVAYGWRQEALTQNAQEISQLGKELYKRLADVGAHMTKLGQDLDRCVGSYNKTVRSFEARLLPGARRFRELNPVPSEEVPQAPAFVENVAKLPQATELHTKSEQESSQEALHLIKSV